MRGRRPGAVGGNSSTDRDESSPRPQGSEGLVGLRVAGLGSRQQLDDVVREGEDLRIGSSAVVERGTES